MCDCLSRFDEALATCNTMLGTIQTMRLDDDFEDAQTRVEIATYKRDPRNRQPKKKVIPTFCPFCGERYRKEEPTPEAAAETAPVTSEPQGALPFAEALAQ